MDFADADWRKFYRDRAWEPLEFEEMSQTAQPMNREPGMMKFFRIIGQAFSGWGAKQRRTWESGVALLRRGIESGMFRCAGREDIGVQAR